MSPNLKAYLDLLAYSELGPGLLKVSDNGYNVVVGSLPSKPILFNSYSDHPRKLVDLGRGLKSTAAGRYQILSRYFDVYKKQLGLKDFGHDAQDRIAIQMISECKALGAIEAGRISEAMKLTNSRWASLPGSPYGQHTNSEKTLLDAFVAAGGTLTP